MADRDLEIVVLKDSQGNYYLLPREGLEQTKVPDEFRSEVEEMVKTAASHEGELSDDQLEAVAGGVSGVGRMVAPSGLGFNGLRSTWMGLDYHADRSKKG